MLTYGRLSAAHKGDILFALRATECLSSPASLHACSQAASGGLMVQFENVFREERFYCNHFFRLLCEGLSDRPGVSGLSKVLGLLSLPKQSADAIGTAEVYTEVACFRDVFFVEAAKDDFLEKLFDQLHPMLLAQYGSGVNNAQRPAQLRKRIGMLHPAKYRDRLKEPEFDKCDVLFYHELGALFNAKPDFLILLPDHANWIEAKCSSAFSTSQIQRMRHIGALCATDLFAEYFGHRQPTIALLGSELRHAKAQKIEGTRFISWQQCAGIAADVFPAGSNDITSRALAQVAAQRAHGAATKDLPWRANSSRVT